MKMFFVGVAVIFAATAVPAYAEPSEFLPTSPAYDWNGFYTGATIGGGFGTSYKTWDTLNERTSDFTTSGVIGGVTAGYNREFGSILSGIEGDFSGSSIGGGTSCDNPAFTCQTNSDWLATLRPRVGYQLGRFVPYVTGGLAVGEVNVQSFRNKTGTGGVNFDQTKFGWTAGAGTEMALFGNWSMKAEYLYVRLGDTEAPSNVGLPTTTSFSENLLRVGLNYKFD